MVTDEKGDPIIGATLINTISKEGTITDIDGKFSFQTNSKGQIKISYIGYENQVVDIKDKSFIKITMFQSIKKLDEVIE